MAYKQFLPQVNLNFQMNRVLTHGNLACREEELWEIAPKLITFHPENWFKEWNNLARRAESEERLMHAAYYHRMSEFFLPDGFPEKKAAYEAFRRFFYQAVESTAFEHFEVPYQDGTLPAMRIKALGRERGLVVLHGGFDSFIEEFYLQVRTIPENGYTLIVFEGPGQGRPLRSGMKMTHEWEKPVSAVLDYFNLDQIALVGVSLGGFLAPRAAAFEPRIAQVAAYDICYDAFECFTHNIGAEFREKFREMVLSEKRDEINALLEAVRKSDDMIDWIITHGMYITGAADPFDYFHYWTHFTTREASHRITQDVLLLAGEKDHFIPVEQLVRQREALVNARSVRSRLFTTAEGGEQHCQVGRLDLALNEIIDWLNGLYPAP